MIYYLSEGNPAEIKRLRKTSQKDVHDYYYLNRVQDLNSLLDHIAYIEYLEKEK